MPHDTSSTDNNKCGTRDRTITDLTTEEHREKECNLIFIEGREELGVVTKILRVVTSVTAFRNANLGCLKPHSLLAIPGTELDISLRGAGHILNTDKVALLLELVPKQEYVAQIK